MIFTIGTRSRAVRAERVYMRGVPATVRHDGGVPERETGAGGRYARTASDAVRNTGRTSGFRARTEKG